MTWAYSEVTGSAGGLHASAAARIASAGVARAVIRVDAAPAVVLGSTEPGAHLDPGAVARAGLDVARRRSGGAAVLVGPGRCIWVDLVVPRDDPLWCEDVGQAAWWVGECWATALAAVSLGGAVVHRGGMQRSRWSLRACFGGLGPGEVTLRGRKVVGVAQRRTRFGALFQCAVPLSGVPDGLRQLAAVQALEPAQRAEMAADLVAGTLAVPSDRASALVEALLEALPPA